MIGDKALLARCGKTRQKRRISILAQRRTCIILALTSKTMPRRPRLASRGLRGIVLLVKARMMQVLRCANIEIRRF